MQITFLTMFLGLVAGVSPVAVSVGPGATAVELRLDGAAAGRLLAPPWRGTVDFGADLLPHHLEAVALDSQGHEAGRVEQWINVPGPQANVQFLMEPEVAGRPRQVRLAWASITRSAPLEVKVSLDGRALALDGQSRVQLPLRPPDSATSVLSVEVRFRDGVVARRDLALGRDYDDSVATELTALPIWVDRHARLPPAADLQDWFRDAGGRSVHVDAVDQGAPQLIVVRAPGARERLRPDPTKPIWATAMQVMLPGSGSMSFIWPTSLANSDPQAELFRGTPAQPLDKYSVQFVLAFTSHDDVPPVRLADAVAVAGLQASAVAGPRAVLLLLAPGAQDASRFTGPMVRRYLQAIHVPLLVWSAGSSDAAMQAAWGPIEDITTGTGVRNANRQLAAAVATQSIVWLTGRHLPQDLALAPAAAAVQLAPPPVR